MYLLVNQWLKVNNKTTLSEHGTTFTTTLDYQEKPRRGKKMKRVKRRNPGKKGKKEKRKKI